MQIETRDGHKIVSILEECGAASEVVLLCHGITSEKNEGGVYSGFASKLRESKLDSLRFDFRGHGESPILDRSASVSGMILDFAACLKVCRDRYNKVHVVSASFGSSIFLLALQNLDIEEAKIQSAALWNPVTDYASTFFKATVEWGPSFFPQGGLLNALSHSPVSFGEDSLEIGPQFVAELLCFRPDFATIPRRLPTRMFHGKADTLVNFRDTEKFKRQRASHAKLKLYEHIDHGLDEVQEDVQKKTIDLILKH